MSCNREKKYVDITPSEDDLSTVVENFVTCDVPGCKKTFTSSGTYMFHKKKSHPVNGMKWNPQKKVDDTVYRYHCPIPTCIYNSRSERHFTSRKNLKQHYGKVHGEKKYVCISCKKGFAFERDLNRHVESCGKVFACATCGCPYTSPEAVLTHCRRNNHVAPDNARSSKRGLKKLEKEKRLEEEQKSKLAAPNPCIIIINQTTNPPVVPESASLSKSSQQAYKLPHILPKSQFTSSVFVDGALIASAQQKSQTSSLQSNLVKIQPKSFLQPTEKSSNLSLNLNFSNETTPVIKNFHRSSIVKGSNESFVLSKEASTQQTVTGIQTDIYGVETLCLDTGDSLSNFPPASVASTGTQSDAATNCHTETSTTGIQTSMSFLPSKKKDCSIAETQTFNECILDQAMISAEIPTLQTISQPSKRSKRTSEVQTNGSIFCKKRKMKVKKSNVGVQMPQENVILDISPSSWTQTNLSVIQSRQDFHLQNTETQTQRLSPQSSAPGVLLDVDSGYLQSNKQILHGNLNLLADATLTNFVPMEVSELGIASEPSARNRRRLHLGDPSIGAMFSSSIDSESQTVTSASDLDILLQSTGLPSASGTDIQTQTAEDELLHFLMTNMETQTTEDLLFPGFGLSDIETQTTQITGDGSTDGQGKSSQDFINSSALLQGSRILQKGRSSAKFVDSGSSTTVCSSGTGPDTSFLLDSLVTTETQTNLPSFTDTDLTNIVDMETQTTFSTVDFFTDLTDSHTQTHFYP